MQMIFSGAGIGGCQMIASRAWSGERRFHQRAGGDGFAQRRIIPGKARGEIDDAGIRHGAISDSAADRISRKAR
jgi:hypothetical protein